MFLSRTVPTLHSSTIKNIFKEIVHVIFILNIVFVQYMLSGLNSIFNFVRQIKCRRLAALTKSSLSARTLMPKRKEDSSEETEIPS